MSWILEQSLLENRKTSGKLQQSLLKILPGYLSKVDPLVTVAQDMYDLKSLVRYKFYRILLVEPKEIAMIMMPLSRHIYITCSLRKQIIAG
jgi:hypothetical protein